MSYVQQFKTARDKYLSKIKDLEPSKTLITFIKEEKPHTLVQNMDTVNGKPVAEMQKVLGAYLKYQPTYIGKLKTQMEAEKQKDKLKGTIKLYKDDLDDIGEEFTKDCLRKKDAEESAVKPKDGAADAKAAGGNAAAQAAQAKFVPKYLAQISDEFKRRRQKHLDVAIQVEKFARDSVAKITPLQEGLQKGVGNAVGFASTGNDRMLGGLGIASKNQVGEIKKLAAASKKFYDDSLEPFFKERNMKAQDVADDLHLDIPKEYKADLDKISQTHSKIFTTATAHTSAANRINEELAMVSDEADSLFDQIQRIASRQDLGKIFLDGALSLQKRLKTVLDTAKKNADKISTTSIQGLASAVMKLETKKFEGKDPEADRVSCLATVRTIGPFIKTTNDEIARTITTAENQIAAERTKIPPDLLKAQPGAVLAQVEKDLAAVKKVHESNLKLAAGLLPKAEKVGA